MDKQTGKNITVIRYMERLEIEVKAGCIHLRQNGVTGEGYTVIIPREYWGMVLNAIDKALIEDK